MRCISDVSNLCIDVVVVRVLGLGCNIASFWVSIQKAYDRRFAVAMVKAHAGLVAPMAFNVAEWHSIRVKLYK